MTHDEVIFRAEPLLSLIRRVEARSDYDIVYGGIAPSLRPGKLTQMTVRDVIAWQRHVVSRGSASSAAGAYQIIRKTLESLSPSVVPLDAAFSKATQDKLGAELLMRRGIDSFLDSRMGTDDFMIALAKEWASFPVPRAMKGASRQLMAGQSYYAGDGLNKALVSIDAVRDALAACRKTSAPDALRPTVPDVPVAQPLSWLESLIAIIKGVFRK